MRGRRRDSGGAGLSRIGALANTIHSGHDIIIRYPGGKIGIGVAQGGRAAEGCVTTPVGGGSLELVAHSARGERPRQEEISPWREAQAGGRRGNRRQGRDDCYRIGHGARRSIGRNVHHFTGTNMDCLYSTGATPVPYPQYYAFDLI